MPKKAVTSVRHLEYREVLEEGSGLRAAAQPRARDRRGDRREEVPLALQREGLRPRRSQLAPAGTLAQPGAAAAAGRLRSAQLRALRPRDGVPRGAPASGARSDTAAAAEPMLGVDCRNRKRDPELSFSRILAFSRIRYYLFDPPQLLKMTSSMAFRCVQAGGRGRSLPCGRSDGPAASRQAASRGCAARGRALAPAAPHRVSRGRQLHSSLSGGAGGGVRFRLRDDLDRLWRFITR